MSEDLLLVDELQKQHRRVSFHCPASPATPIYQFAKGGKPYEVSHRCLQVPVVVDSPPVSPLLPQIDRHGVAGSWPLVWGLASLRAHWQLWNDGTRGNGARSYYLTWLAAQNVVCLFGMIILRKKWIGGVCHPQGLEIRCCAVC